MLITAEKFERATGHKPEQDDLERYNCKQAGEFGHYYCGWNSSKDMPCFMVGPETKKDKDNE